MKRRISAALERRIAAEVSKMPSEDIEPVHPERTFWLEEWYYYWDRDYNLRIANDCYYIHDPDYYPKNKRPT